jgi:hypothetical protein
MRRHTLRLLLAMAILASLLPATTATARTSLLREIAAEADAAGSPNMSHIANLPHKKRNTSGAFIKAPKQDGTDIEFATLSVPVKDATGAPVLDEFGQPVMENRDFAFAGSYNNGLQIVDITDPTKPVTTGIYDCAISQGDVQVFTRLVDGVTRTYVTYTADNGYSVGLTSMCVREAKALNLPGVGKWVTGHGTYIADVTNPAAPVTVSFYENPQGSHNQTVAPGGMYLYNSNSDIGAVDGRMDPADQTGRIEVIDISDFKAPKEVARLPLVTGADSHDITFSADGKRAYTAALTHTLVINTENLAAPTIVGRIIDPSVNIHHQADPVTMKDKTTGLEREFLIVSDELAGAAGNAVCPGGGLHVYDITDQLELAPVKVGFWAAPDVHAATDNLTCTSHVLRLHPKEGIMTIAWYEAGVHVVDINGLVGVSVGAQPSGGNVTPGMKEIGYYSFADSDTWSAKTNRIAPDGSFYLFGNDMVRGLDVYKFTKSAPAATDGGTWLNPKQALATAKLRGVGTTQGPICLLPNRGISMP